MRFAHLTCALATGLALALVAGLVAGLAAAPAVASAPAPDEAMFRAIYRELVEINTTDSRGDTVKAARAMAARLIAGGLPRADVKVLSSGPRKGNMVARLRGTTAMKPMLLAAHIDVVEARREDWQFDPFKLQEVGGYFRGRGTVDDKAMAAIFVANLIRLHREGVKPGRDIILALTTDEELADSPHNGMHWLIDHHRKLIDAEFAINEGGGGTLIDGKPVRLNLQLAEKIYRSFRLEVKDPGGHSAMPRRDTAINRLAEALVRLSNFEFPARLNEVTRAYFAGIGRQSPEVLAAIKSLEAGDTSPQAISALIKRPAYNVQLRTTCVATMLAAGHAENALPQSASATVNCRLLPDEQPAFVEAEIRKAVADDRVTVVPLGAIVESPVTALSPAVLKAVETIAAEMWPGVPVIPTQSGGYTDSRWLRRAGVATYGVSGLFTEEGRSGAHGLNEQVGVAELLAAREFLYKLVKTLAATGP